jgi:hypothetical protein
MTKFLSKFFLSGILLTSINGYCTDNGKIDALAGVEGYKEGFSVQLESDQKISSDIEIGTKLDNGFYYDSDTKQVKYYHQDRNTNLFDGTVSKAELVLNGKKLQLSKDNATKLIIGQFGQISDSGTIGLNNKWYNIAEFVPGSSAGQESKNGVEEKVVTVQNGTVNLQQYITFDSSNRPVFNYNEAKKLHLKLNNIKLNLFSSEYSVDQTSNLIGYINNMEETNRLFSNIKSNAAKPTTINKVPYLFDVTNHDSMKTIDDYSELLSNTIELESIPNSKLSLLLGDNNINGDLNAQDLLNSLVRGINADGVTKTGDQKNATINLSSFYEFDSSISLKTLVNDLKSKANNNVSLLVDEYTFEPEYTDDTKTTMKSAQQYEGEDFVTINKLIEPIWTGDVTQFTISGVKNTLLIPSELNSISRAFSNSKVSYNGGTSDAPHVMTNLTLSNDAEVKINGVIQVKGTVTAEKDTVLVGNPGGKIILGAGE